MDAMDAAFIHRHRAARDKTDAARAVFVIGLLSLTCCTYAVAHNVLPLSANSSVVGINTSALDGSAHATLFMSRRFAPGDELTAYAQPRAPDSARYTRCKEAHRCAQAYSSYDARNAVLSFEKSFFPGGQREPASLFLDFEDWRAGTAGLSANPSALRHHPLQTRGAHFNSFWPELDAILRPALHLNHSCTLHFDTTALVATVECDPVPETPRLAVRRRRRPVRLYTPFVGHANYGSYNTTALYAQEDAIPVVAPGWSWLSEYTPHPSVSTPGVAVTCTPATASFLPRMERGDGKWTGAAQAGAPGPAYLSPAHYGDAYHDGDGDGYPDDPHAFSPITGYPTGVSARVADVRATGCAYYRYRYNVTGARLYTRHGSGKASPWHLFNSSRDGWAGVPRPNPRVVNGTWDGLGGDESPAGVPTAVFHFESLFLGPSVRVTVSGALPLVLVSRSAMVIDTPLEVTPGTAGGWSGCRGAQPAHVNLQGPGTTVVRTYSFSLTLGGVPTLEVQRVRTYVDDGQSLRGWWALTLPATSTGAWAGEGGGVEQTTWIPAHAEPGTVAAAIMANLRGAGNVTVTRSNAMAQGGYTYTISFSPLVQGNIPQLGVLSRLTGYGSGIASDTVTNASDGIGGSFSLKWRGTPFSSPLSVQASGGAVQEAMMSSWASVGLQSARVTRSASMGRDPFACLSASTHGRTASPGPVFRLRTPYGNGEVVYGPGGLPPNAQDASDTDDPGAPGSGPTSTLYSPDSTQTVPVDVLLEEGMGSAGGAGSGGMGTGACVNGPGPSWGVVYSISLVTHVGVLESVFPSSQDLLSSRSFPPSQDMVQAALAHAAGVSGGAGQGADLSPYPASDALTRLLGLPPASFPASYGAEGAEDDAAAALHGDVALARWLALQRVWEWNISHGEGGMLAQALSLSAQARGSPPTRAYPDPLYRYFSYGRYPRRWVYPAGESTLLPTRRLTNASTGLPLSFNGTAAAFALDGVDPTAAEVAVQAVLRIARLRALPRTPLVSGAVGPRYLFAAAAHLAPILTTAGRALSAHPPDIISVDSSSMTGLGAFARVSGGHWASEATGLPSHAWLRPGDSFTGTVDSVERALLHNESSVDGRSLMDISWGVGGAVDGAGNPITPGPPNLVHKLGLGLSAYIASYGRDYGSSSIPGPDATVNATFPYADTSAWMVSSSYGGAGASHGGTGGEGHGPAGMPPRAPVGDAGMSDLLGGSGGACGGAVVEDVLAFSDSDAPVGGGGAGGGAVELIATTDLILGRHSSIRVDGSDGEPGARAGGGGAGGAVLLAAGGSITVQGDVSARGGGGGAGFGAGGRGGGGGSGGRVALFGGSIGLEEGGSVRVGGGPGGRDEAVQGNTGGAGGSARVRRKEEPDALYADLTSPPSPVLTSNPTYNGIPRALPSALCGGEGTVALIPSSTAVYGVDVSAPSSPAAAFHGGRGGAEDTRRCLRVSTVPQSGGGVGDEERHGNTVYAHAGPWVALARPDSRGHIALRRGGPADLLLRMSLTVHLHLNTTLSYNDTGHTDFLQNFSIGSGAALHNVSLWASTLSTGVSLSSSSVSLLRDWTGGYRPGRTANGSASGSGEGVGEGLALGTAEDGFPDTEPPTASSRTAVARPAPERVTLYVRLARREEGALPARGSWGLHVALHDDPGWDSWAVHALGGTARGEARTNVTAAQAAAGTAGNASSLDSSIPLFLPALRAADAAGVVSRAVTHAAARARAVARLLPPCLLVDSSTGLVHDAVSCLLRNSSGHAVAVHTDASVRVAVREGNWVPHAALPDPPASLLALARGGAGRGPYWYAAPPVASVGSPEHDSAHSARAWMSAREKALLNHAGHAPEDILLPGASNASAWNGSAYVPGMNAGFPSDLLMSAAEHSFVYTTGGMGGGGGGQGAYPDGSGLPLDPFASVEDDGNASGVHPARDGAAMIGMAIVNGRWVHGSNYRGTPSLGIGVQGQGRATPDRWYKLDVFIDWAVHTYKIRIDDVTVALDQPFLGESVTRVGLYVFDQSTAWFDELYAGADDTLGFECPVSKAEGEALRMRRPVQSAWRDTDVGPSSAYWSQSRHANHLSQREMYTHPAHAGLVLGDGQSHRSFHSDVGASARANLTVSGGPAAADATALVAGADSGPASIVATASTVIEGAEKVAGEWEGEDGASAGEVLAGSLLYVRGDEPGGSLLDAALTDGVPNDEEVNRGQSAYGVDGRAPTEPRGRYEGTGIGAGGRSSRDGGDWLNGADIPSHGSEQAARGGYAGSTGAQWWYGEHSNPAHVWYHPDGRAVYNITPGTILSVNGSTGEWDSYVASESSQGGNVSRRLEPRPWYSGGVCGCSTRDLVTWRNEGTVLHDMNVTNQDGIGPSNATKPAPYASGVPGPVSYRSFRPRVILNLRFSPAELLSLYPGLAWGSSAINCTLSSIGGAGMNGSAVGVHPLCYNGTIRGTPGNVSAPGYALSQSSPSARVVDDAGGPDGTAAGGLDGGDPYGDGYEDEEPGATRSSSDSQASPFANGTVVIHPSDLHAILNRSTFGKALGAEYAGAAYVMWMGVDDHEDSRRMAGVAVSLRPGGPFIFLNSLRPDGNETVDHTVLQDPATGRAVLVRTYYTTTTFLLPERIMQPVWESVKNADLTTVDFAASYHRAVYTSDYDNPNDIWRQRWRLEDLPWLIITGDWRETFDPVERVFNLSNAVSREMKVYTPEERFEVVQSTLGKYLYRDIQGQGLEIMTSRFQDPNDPAKSAWKPSSVPLVRAQPWADNYRDKNIADNPPHPTKADLLIGVDRIAEQRRASYIVISELDYEAYALTGVVCTLEGSTPLLSEVDGESAYPQDAGPANRPRLRGKHRPGMARDRLLAILAEYGRFGWEVGSGSNGNSTYQPAVFGSAEGSSGTFPFVTEVDWSDRFWQFNNTYGDRELDFRNFRDRQDKDAYLCPDAHHLVLIKLAECQAIMNYGLRYQNAPPLKNYRDIETSFYYAMDTSEYESCLAEHSALLTSYETCLRGRTPSLHEIDEWSVGDRECTGGGGVCGPPQQGDRPNATYGFKPFSRAAYGLSSTAFEPDLSAYNASESNAAVVPSYYGTAMGGRAAGAKRARRQLGSQDFAEEESEGQDSATPVKHWNAGHLPASQSQALDSQRGDGNLHTQDTQEQEHGSADSDPRDQGHGDGKGTQERPLTAQEREQERRLRAAGVSLPQPV